jgi:hypothetical protein
VKAGGVLGVGDENTEELEEVSVFRPECAMRELGES